MIDTSGGCTNEVFSCTLVWNDPPALPGCTTCLIHNLDLYVQKNDDESYYYPNGLTYPDTINPTERVRISEVKHGDKFTLFVTSEYLVEFQQNYSIVASGCFGGTGNLIDMDDTAYVVEEEDDDSSSG